VPGGLHLEDVAAVARWGGGRAAGNRQVHVPHRIVRRRFPQHDVVVARQGVDKRRRDVDEENLRTRVDRSRKILHAVGQGVVAVVTGADAFVDLVLGRGLKVPGGRIKGGKEDRGTRGTGHR